MKPKPESWIVSGAAFCMLIVLLLAYWLAMEISR